MLPNLFMLTTTGELVLEKHWNHVCKKSVCDLFWSEMSKSMSNGFVSNGMSKDSGVLNYDISRSVGEIPPVMNVSNHYFVHVFRNGMYFVSVTDRETPPLFQIAAIESIVNILKSYFSKFDEDAIKENFFLVNEILNELNDAGFPLTTEINPLHEMIKPPTLMNKMMKTLTEESHLSGCLPTSLATKIPWRTEKTYVQNEIYFDLLETVDAILTANNTIVHAEVYGSMECLCNLSGIPDLEISFHKPNLVLDAQLHKCVRISKFDKEKVVSFVPPDGNFTLLTYRVDELSQVPIFIRPQVTLVEGQGRIHIAVTPRFCDGKTIEDLQIKIPLPNATMVATNTCTSGSFKYDESSKVITWTIGNLAGTLGDKACTFSSTFTTANSSNELIVLLANFRVKGFGLSGLKIDNLVVQNVKYRPFRGIRYETKAGRFQIRCD